MPNAALVLDRKQLAECGIDPDLWSRAESYSRRLVEEGTVPAVGFQLVHRGRVLPANSYGTRELAGHTGIDSQTRFLVASLTKPMVAMAILKLVESGQVTLNQRVSELVPEFKGPNKRQITLKHLLTHTSGLPDMLPNNRELRAANASLMEFVKQTSAVDLTFPSGTGAQYQSMGFALLGPLIENVSGESAPSYLKSAIFEPLGMTRTVLGLPEDELDDENIAEVNLPADQVGEDRWNWNSRYWKSFGAPWGGVLSTVEDVGKFCAAMLNDGVNADGQRLWSARTIELATTNRLHDFPDIPEPVRRTRGWGYGWRMNWLDHRGSFGDLLRPDVCGHWGATGTLFWIDRQTQTALVILSSQPYDRQVSPLVGLSNLIVASLTN